MSEYKLDSVAQSRNLGQTASLDEMSRRAEELSNGLSPQVTSLAPVQKKPEKRKGLWTAFGTQDQLNQADK